MQESRPRIAQIRTVTIVACLTLGFLATYAVAILVAPGTGTSPTAGDHPVDAEQGQFGNGALTHMLDRAISSVSQSARIVTEAREDATAREAGPVASTHLSRWHTLPRDSTAFDIIVVVGPLEATRLLRNTHANPRDIFISEQGQAILHDYCDGVSHQIRSLEQVAANAAASDLMKLVEQGKSRAKQVRELNQRLAPQERAVVERAHDRMASILAEKLGKSVEEVKNDPTTVTIAPHVHFKDHSAFAYASIGGEVHSATTDELPNVGPVMDAKRWACFEVASVLCTFFVQHGCLDPQEADQLMSRVVTRLNRPPFGGKVK